MIVQKKHRPDACADAGPLAALLDHAETVEIAPLVAGDPPTQRRQPAHVRLARRGLIEPDVEDWVEGWCIAWERVEGGIHQPGDGGDGLSGREEVLLAAAARVRLGAARVGQWGERLVVASCVLCLPAWQVAIAAGVYIVECPPPRQWKQHAIIKLDRALVPWLYRLAGIPRGRCPSTEPQFYA